VYPDTSAVRRQTFQYHIAVDAVDVRGAAALDRSVDERLEGADGQRGRRVGDLDQRATQRRPVVGVALGNGPGARSFGVTDAGGFTRERST